MRLGSIGSGYIATGADAPVTRTVELETQGQLERFVHITASLVAIREALNGRTGTLFLASVGALVIMKMEK